MPLPDVKGRFTASKDALKAIYFVLIGLAITEALGRVFLEGGAFRGIHVSDQQTRPQLLLLLAFLPTISRLAHGSSIHLDNIHTSRFKPLLDFFGFLLQGSIFYVMALSIGNVTGFTLLFGVLTVGDIVWLLVLLLVPYIEFDNTVKQWLVSDGLMLLVLIGVWWVRPDPVTSSVVIFIAASIATVADYVLNRDFYFPEGAIVR